MLRLTALLLSLSFGLATLTAQTVDDVLRYSETGTFGTARSLGTGNSLGAIGADWTAVHTNPAGLAAYRRNEIGLTLGTLIPTTTESSLVGDGKSLSSSEAKFAIPHVSFVFTKKPIASRWTQVNFGIGLAQNRRFEEVIAFDGFGAGSITDLFIESSNYTYTGGSKTVEQLNDFDEYLAYQVAAIRDEYAPDEIRRNQGLYTSDYDQERLYRQANGQAPAELRKRGQVSRSGQSSSIDMSFAANYDEKFLIGATLAITRSRFDEENRYTETDPNEAVFYFDELTYRRNLATTGTGIQLKLGGIYRMSQALRIGLSYYSPNALLIEDDYTTSMRYLYTDGANVSDEQASSPTFDPLTYTIITPSTFKASVASIIGKRGFVGAELGYVNHSGGRIQFDSSDDDNDLVEEAIKDEIKDRTQGAIQAKIGGEVNLAPIQVRLGAEYVGAPVKGEDPSYNFSTGVGFRKKRFAVDLGYQLGMRADRVFQPYRVSFDQFDQPAVNYSTILHTAALTVSYKLNK